MQVVSFAYGQTVHSKLFCFSLIHLDIALFDSLTYFLIFVWLISNAIPFCYTQGDNFLSFAEFFDTWY
jgi:hypothetical protein